MDECGGNVEVCVVGGGPAGSTIAHRLAVLGHDVVLVERSPFPRTHIGESLPPTILPALEILGVREVVEGAGFLRPREAIVRWAGAPRRKKSEGENAGFQVDRGRFDHLLLKAAKKAGVRILQPARARTPTHGDGLHGPGTGPGAWHIPLSTPGGPAELRADYLVLAIGKSPAFGQSRERLSPATLALTAYWSNVPEDGPETRIEAAENAWFWGAPLPDGTWNATVFVDPRRAVDEGRSIDALYRSLLARSELLAGCLRGEMATPVTGCDASSYVTRAPIFERGLRVGEACLAIDPLSSQGVATAIRSALQAAAVVHTTLRFPADAKAAIEFYRQRVEETVDHHRRIAARFYQAQALAPRSRDRFWQERGQGPPRKTPVRSPRAAPPAPEEKVLLHAEARLSLTPVLEGERILRRPALVHPALARPMAFLAGEPLAPLLESIRHTRHARDVVRDWSSKIGERRARELLELLWSRGILIAP